MRMQDCKEELHSLLQEDVWHPLISGSYTSHWLTSGLQRLAGASLLVFANKQDIQGSMSSLEIRDVRAALIRTPVPYRSHVPGSRPPVHPDASMADPAMQCDNRTESGRRTGLGRRGSRKPVVLLIDRRSDRSLEIGRRPAGRASGGCTIVNGIAGFVSNVTAHSKKYKS